MKIKADFITNSSSTAYVVFIPNNFKTTRNQAQKVYKNDYYCDTSDKAFSDKIFKDIEESLETLKEGTPLWTYGDEGTPAPIYYAVLEICNINGFIVADSEMGGEGNNSIFGIKEEQIISILKNNIDLFDLVKTVNKGVELCYEAEKGSP